MTGDAPDRPRRRGFTLIELLVVLLIIGVLASLLLPVLSRSQAAARNVRCKSNLHQVGLGVALYLADEAAYPMAVSAGWRGGLQKALRPLVDREVFRCPETVRVAPIHVAAYGFPSPKVGLHYGYNWRGTAPVLSSGPGYGLGGKSVYEAGVVRYSRTRESAVIAPSSMVAAGDSQASVGLASPLLSLAYEDQIFAIFPRAVEQTFEDGVLQRFHPGVGHWHNEGANMLFADGHVEHGRQDQWTALTPDARRKWNLDHLPHEESW